MGCPNSQDPFVLGEASILLGYAALANVTSTDDSATSTATGTTASDASTTTTSNTCQDGSTNTKIGVGVGVPLGAIALAALAWGLWERRKRTKAASMAGAGAGTDLNPGSSTGVVEYHAVQPQWSDYSGKPHSGVAQDAYSQAAHQVPTTQAVPSVHTGPAAQAELYNEPPRAEMMAPGRNGQLY